MKILVVAEGPPATSELPGSPRLACLCAELSKEHDLDLIALNHASGKAEQYLNALHSARIFQNIELLSPAKESSWLYKQIHRLKLAPSKFDKYRYPAFHRAVLKSIQAAVAKDKYDLIYVNGLTMTQYLSNYTTGPKVVDICDSMTGFFRRQAKMQTSVKRRIAYELEAWSVSRWEKHLGKWFDLIVTISEPERDAILSLSPQAKTLVIPNGVDTKYFSPQGSPKPERLVFYGVMSYGPNTDAALFFSSEVFPLITKHAPTAEFWIVGMKPPDAIMELGKLPGITVTGEVADIRLYIGAAGVVVCPLRYGAGVKNKVISAMAMRRPVVTTSIGLEGIGANPGKHLLVADGPAEIADAVVKLIGNQQLADSVARAGYDYVHETFSWEERARPLNEAFKQLAKR